MYFPLDSPVAFSVTCIPLCPSLSTWALVFAVQEVRLWLCISNSFPSLWFVVISFMVFLHTELPFRSFVLLVFNLVLFHDFLVWIPHP